MARVPTGDDTGSPPEQQETPPRIEVRQRTSADDVVTEFRFLGWQQIFEAAVPVIARAARQLSQAAQDNQKAQPISLAAMVDTPAMAERRAENRREGRLIASETRRRQRIGEERTPAMRAAGETRGRPFSEAEILVKQHNCRLAAKIHKLRAGVIARGKRDGLSNRALAKRLHVTPQHVGRIIAEIEKGKQQ